MDAAPTSAYAPGTFVPIATASPQPQRPRPFTNAQHPIITRKDFRPWARRGNFRTVEQMSPLLPAVWISCGVVIMVAAARSRRSRHAARVGQVAVGALYLGAGALVNVLLLATGEDYADFAHGRSTSRCCCSAGASTRGHSQSFQFTRVPPKAA